MKKFILTLALAGFAAYAQEHGAAPAEGHGGGHEAASHEAAGHEAGDPTLPAKWINFAILAAGLGFVIIKAGIPALKGQQQAILDGMNSAAKKAEATSAQAAEIEKRISNLDLEVAGIREKALGELAAEKERIGKETATLVRKVEQDASAEIASAAKFAQAELKAHTGRLALELAEQKVRARMTPEAQQALVGRFVDSLGKN